MVEISQAELNRRIILHLVSAHEHLQAATKEIHNAFQYTGINDPLATRLSNALKVLYSNHSPEQMGDGKALDLLQNVRLATNG